MNIFANKVFVVTGAGSGIGQALTSELLQRGASVAAVDINPDGLEQTRALAGNFADSLSLHTLDITDRDTVQELPERVKQRHSSFDGLINCAGIIQPFVRVQDLDYPTIDRVMGVNFYGTLYMTKTFLPYLLRREQAYLVNVSSMGGFLPVPGQSLYGASKAAVKLMTEGLYAESLGTSVKVSLVLPGATATNIAKNSNVEIPGMSAQDQRKMSSRALSADKAARVILSGVEKSKPQIYTGNDSKFMNVLYRLSPIVATKFIARQMRSLLK